MKEGFSLLAIDGGGTRCRLTALAGERRLSVEVGACNVSTDLDAAVAEIRRGLERLAEQAAAPLASLREAPAYAGLAGVTSAELAGELAERLPLARVRIEDDRRAAVRGALQTGDGGVAHCGTGSFVAVQRDREIRLCGGWGAVLGDRASAMWVGREALGLTLDVADGIRAPSPLTRALLARFGSTAGIVTFAGQASPAALGALAPQVTAAAASDDPAAVYILRRGAGYLERTLDALGWSAPLPLVLSGGLASSYPAYLAAPLRSALIPPRGQPIDGALSLARDFAEEEAA